MDNLVKLFLFSALAAVLGSGCVAIPMGSETYRHEYPTDIRPTSDSPTKTYEAEPTVSEGDGDRRTVVVGLNGKVTFEQPQVQHYKAVSVDKRKRLSVGLFPNWAQQNLRPKGSLTPVGAMMFYNGNGEYSEVSRNTGDALIQSQKKAESGGAVLSILTLGLVSTPIALFAEMFGPYEKDDQHFLGSMKVSTSSQAYGGNIWRGGQLVRTTTYDSTDIDLLRKFPMGEREKIGAWTWHENATHPYHSFWHGFELQWFGVFKYCNFFVKDEGAVSKTTPAAPSVTTRTKTTTGPFSVILSLPSLGFAETAEVEPGRTSVTFNLLDAANGDSFANGTVRFLPPAGGLAAVRDEDGRAILELAMEKEWPVTVALPAPRLGKVKKTDEGGMARPEVAPYQIASIGRTGDGKGLVVRVAVSDTSRTFDIDRTVQPEVRRLFREQFATGENAGRRESVLWKTENGGKTLLYTVTFE